jgi:hypothetical protein
MIIKDDGAVQISSLVFLNSVGHVGIAHLFVNTATLH